MASSCKKGYYFCNSSQKCKRIPRGHKVQSDGELVREYVSDWRSDLGENLGINMPTVRPGQLTSTGGRGKPVDLPNPDSKQFKSTGGRGKAVDLPKVKTGQFKEEIQGGINVEPYTKDTKFLEVETVDIIKPKALNASDWRNELEIVEEGAKNLFSTPFADKLKNIEKWKENNAKLKKKFGWKDSYEVDLENLIVEMLEEDIQALYENGFSYDEVAEFYGIEQDLTEVWGAVGRGAWEGAKIIATKVAKPALNYAKNRAVKDIRTVSKFVRDPQNWKRANKDFDKLAIPAAKGAKNVANFVKQLPARTYNLGKSFRQFADKGYKALKGRAQKIIEPIQKKGQVDRAKYKKYQDLVNRANRLAKSSKERAGQIVDVSPKIKSLPPGKENLLNKLRSTMTNIKRKGGSLATVAKDKGSALVSKVKSLAKKAKEKTKQLTGLNQKATLPSSTTSKKSNLKGIKTAALTTGLVAGGLTLSNRKDKITALDDVSVDKSKDSSTITNDGKKSVDPKKNEVVTKTSTTPKGRTKWVGANTTWVDRHGKVIAPKAKENKKYKYGRTGSHLKPLEQEEAN